MKVNLEQKELHELVADILAYEAEAFEDDLEVNACDLLDEFVMWRVRLKAMFPSLAVK